MNWNPDEFLTTYRFKQLCNGNDIIYCPVGKLPLAFSQIRHDCVIICTGDDGGIMPMGVSKSHLDKNANVTYPYDFNIWEDAILPKNIKAIFAANVDIQHDKIIPIPRGLEDFERFSELKKKEYLTTYSNTDMKQEKLLYVNCSISTNPHDRTLPYEIFHTNDWCTVETGDNWTNFENFCLKIKNHKFVLSPDGNGFGCHRTWESLYLGSIPIVQRHVFTEEFSKDVPMVIVDSWEEVTEEFLNNEYDRLMSMEWNWEICKLSYWQKRIMEV